MRPLERPCWAAQNEASACATAYHCACGRKILHMQTPVLTVAVGTFAITPLDMMAKPPFPEAVVRQAPWPPS
eukprot:6523243-Alexandrium_andersonii.AAC.1